MVEQDDYTDEKAWILKLIISGIVWAYQLQIDIILDLLLKEEEYK